MHKGFISLTYYIIYKINFVIMTALVICKIDSTEQVITNDKS